MGSRTYRYNFLWLALCASAGADAVPVCEKLASAQDVVACALETHPEIRRAEAGLAQGEAAREKAAQRPNPELSSKAGYGRQEDEPVVNTETSLLHTFELGGKRGARIEKAVAEQGVLTQERLRAREDVFIETALTLNRLRQAGAEAETLDEAIATFHQIASLFATRPRLTPEQSVSANVFRLAELDYRTRRASLTSEKEALARSLQLWTGSEAVLPSTILPSTKTVWPDLAEDGEATKGSYVRIAEAERLVADAELGLAKSEAWPDLKVGPVFETQRQPGQNYNTLGLALNVPLPLYQANGGGKAYAAALLTKREVELANTRRAAAARRFTWLARYRNAVTALSNPSSAKELERHHRDLERLFQRGVISSPLVIETHRQMYDALRSRHEQELQALEANLRIAALEGRLFEEKL